MRKINNFGAKCHYYNESQKQKFDSRGYEGYYLGINTSSQGYYVLTDSQRVITSRNVKVHNMPQDIHNTPESSSAVPLPAQDIQQTDGAPEQFADTTEDSQDDSSDTQPAATSRPVRERKQPDYLKDYSLSATIDHAYAVISSIPETYEEAISSNDATLWKAAMDKEIETLNLNDTWKVQPLPSGRSETKGRWVYTLKQSKEAGQVQYKARYVAKGFSQVHGVDYHETYSPTTRFTSIRALLQKATNDKLHLHQLDVKGAYLNAPIDTDIYLQQPPGYEQSDHDTQLTCHLNKSLYGLKQSGRNWHSTLTTYLKKEGFTANDNDPCVYTSSVEGEHVIVLFWVDDIIVASQSLNCINVTKQNLCQRFNMDDRGAIRWFLGIDFQRLDNASYTMAQERYIGELLERFGMTDCKRVNTPARKTIWLTS